MTPNTAIRTLNIGVAIDVATEQEPPHAHQQGLAICQQHEHAKGTIGATMAAQHNHQQPTGLPAHAVFGLLLMVIMASWLPRHAQADITDILFACVVPPAANSQNVLFIIDDSSSMNGDLTV